MSQRTIQQSVSQYLSGDAEVLRPRKVAQLKRQTAVDLGIEVFLGPNSYHRSRKGIPGCPNSNWELEPGTIEDAIKDDLDPCGSCNPADYQVLESHPASDDETAIALPEERPASAADLNWIIHTRGNTRRTAHIAGTGGEDPEPLCACAGTYRGGNNWACKARSVYPDPDDWFELCEHCLAEYDQIMKKTG